MPNLVTDPFTEGGSGTIALTTHTATTGQGWTENQRTGALGFLVDRSTDVCVWAGAEANVSVIYTVNADPATAEYDITATISTVTGGDAQPLLLIARYTDTNNMYGAGIYRTEQTPGLKIWKKVAGVVTELASGDTAVVATDVFKFEIRNAAKKLYKNSVEVLTTADNALTSIGRGGMGGGQVFVAGDDLGAWRVTQFLLDEISAAVADPYDGSVLRTRMRQRAWA
jgi:hypothetical protein